MCIVCVDLIKQNMTILEAERNLDELISVTAMDEKTRKLIFHQFKLKDALEVMDLDEMADALDEGVRDEAPAIKV